MKVRILEPAFFNNIYLNKGEIVDLNIDECPSWAEVIGEKPKADNLVQKENNDNNNAEGQGKEEKPIFNEVELADEAKKEKLEELLNKAFDKGILLEGTENKTVDEQIKELEELLKG